MLGAEHLWLLDDVADPLVLGAERVRALEQDGARLLGVGVVRDVDVDDSGGPQL